MRRLGDALHLVPRDTLHTWTDNYKRTRFPSVERTLPAAGGGAGSASSNAVSGQSQHRRLYAPVVRVPDEHTRPMPTTVSVGTPHVFFPAVRRYFRESSLLRKADERSPTFFSQLTLECLHQLSACPPSHCSYGSVSIVANVVHSRWPSLCAGRNSPHSRYCFCPLAVKTCPTRTLRTWATAPECARKSEAAYPSSV
jgi:hypothetical protein